MKRVSVALLTLLMLSGVAAGSDMDHSALHGQMHRQNDQWNPREGGQAAFAAIQEIVAHLEADPNTDWSKVDIEALRQHLIDMDNVTLRAQATSKDVPGGIQFLITGKGRVVASIRRMVFAHADIMNGRASWNYTAAKISAGASLTVTVSNPQDATEVKALGFIGVLAEGSHHQMHHLMMATGQMPHAATTPGEN